jgi:hypothetical protein
VSDPTPLSPFVHACQEAFKAWQEAAHADKARAWQALHVLLTGQQRPAVRDFQKDAAGDEQ